MEALPFQWLCLVTVLYASLTTADIYFHVPRGSNNRLNEKSAARKNANRMFDSQVCMHGHFVNMYYNNYHGHFVYM